MQWQIWFNRVSNDLVEQIASGKLVEWWAIITSALLLLCFVGWFFELVAVILQRGGDRHD